MVHRLSGESFHKSDGRAGSATAVHADGANVCSRGDVDYRPGGDKPGGFADRLKGGRNRGSTVRIPAGGTHIVVSSLRC